MWRNGQVRSGDVPAEREEQGAAESGGEVPLPTHTAPRPCTLEDRHNERLRHTQTDRDTQTDTDRHTDRQTHRQTHTDTDRRIVG